MSLRDPQATFSDTDLASSPTIEEEEDEDGRRSRNGSETSSLGAVRASDPSRHWRDVFWLLVFLVHLVALGSVLAILGMNRFRKADRLNIDRFTNITGMGNASHPQAQPRGELTETFWPFYGVAGGVGTVLAWAWLLLLGSKASQMMKVSFHNASVAESCEDDDGGRWWLLVVFSVSLFWTGAVLCNTVHVIVSAAIRTLRWEIRGVRSKIGNNECLLCCVDFLFHLVETLVRFFNKLQLMERASIVQQGMLGSYSSPLGLKRLLPMIVQRDELLMVGSTAALMGMILRWDAEFFRQMAEALHQRLQYRSARAREVMNSRLDHLPDTPPL
ncbi:putative CTL-like protein [Cocos nucifera]|nr:putative CTL-like protein [Cocos nucifera]